MKKRVKILLAAAALTCSMAFPAYAAETKSEYREASAPVRSEMKELENELKPIREENKSSAARYKSIRLAKKNGETVSVSKENWTKAKELHKNITAIKKENKGTTAKSLKAEAKAAAKAKDYDTALKNLNQALDIKESRSESVKEINEIWNEIDNLLK